MSTDIGVVQGLIELKDDFTSQLGLAEAALGNFSRKNQESLTAVAGAAGLVVAAFGLVAAATIELGKRGADVIDVEQTVEHFAGSAKQAAEDIEALRAGTKGTVDDFLLAKDAAHLLSAGVKLTAEDFGTLGQAAFVLQNRGLGGTKEQLDLVSDALVTGRTRALAMSLGVIDAGDSEQKFAEKLGVTKEQLSQSGVAEARRIAVMGMLKAAVKDAGVQERDFGEQLEAARATITNFVDDAAKAIAQSPVFAAGMNAIGEAFTETFGTDHDEMIKTTVHWIEQAAITALDFAQGAITVARIVEGAWQGIRTVVLGVATVIVGFAETVLEDFRAIAIAGNALHIIPDSAVATLTDARNELRGMTIDLAKQTGEAAKAVFGHTEFDKTLDTLSDTVGGVRKAMSDASLAEEKNAEATGDAKKSATALDDASKKLNSTFIDQAKIQTALTKSSKELAGIWDDYFAAVAKNTGTSGQQQRAEIEATFNKQVAALDALDPLFNAKYAAYRATADQALKGIASDWDSVKDKSIEALDETAKKERNTYDEMINSTLHFTRDTLDEQLRKTHEAEDAARGMGAAFVKAHQDAADEAEKQKKKLEDIEKAAKAAAAAARALGGSFEVNKGNLAQTVQGLGQGQNLAKFEKYAHEGFSFSEILDAMRGGYEPKEPKGPRIPGFREGGLVDIKVGEQGPETVRVPLGSMVFPGGSAMGGGGNNVTNHIYVNDTLRDAARKVADEIMRTAKQDRMFGAA